MQEAFVAALLAIAKSLEGSAIGEKSAAGEISDAWVDVSASDDDLDDNKFWKAIKLQIEILREGMDTKQ